MQVQHMNGETEPLARRLDAGGWALFIIWIGIVLLFHMGWGWALIGMAAIVLGEAVVRWFKALPLHGFSIAMGLVLLLGGIWQLLPVSWPFIPVLIIGFGLAFLWNVFRPAH